MYKRVVVIDCSSSYKSDYYMKVLNRVACSVTDGNTALRVERVAHFVTVKLQKGVATSCYINT